MTAEIDLWMSASRSSDKKYVWCTDGSEFDRISLNWKSGEPSNAGGECISVKFSKKSAHLTTYAMGQCAEKRKFVCEVF